MKLSLSLSMPLLFSGWTYMASGVVTCPGGGVCPNANTCCGGVDGDNDNKNGSQPSASFFHGSSCITGKPEDPPGACCSSGGGACGGYYNCKSMPKSKSTEFVCERKPEYSDLPEVGPRILPRLKPCHLEPSALENVYGLPIKKKDDDNDAMWMAPYYSTIPLERLSDDEQSHRIKTVVISVHGSRGNADDYLCCTNSALPHEDQNPAKSSILLLSPWFAGPKDGPISLANTSATNASVLYWRYYAAPMPNWLPFSFRYGADSINGSVSSFTVLDTLLDVILALKLPHLKRIVLTGHSAGGQYTQRWALLSNHSLLTQYEDWVSSSRAATEAKPLPSLRVVVANPKSYCYLDPRRYQQDSQSFQIPSRWEFLMCPLYNEWTWGLDNTSHSLPTPYKTQALHDVGGIAGLVHRFKYRPVVYLSGHMDVLPNGQCMDHIQGPNRRERSRRYYSYLQNAIYTNETRGGKPVHHRVEVPMVHHDHCLLYQSPKGQLALFGNNLDPRGGGRGETGKEQATQHLRSHVRSRRFDQYEHR